MSQDNVNKIIITIKNNPSSELDVISAKTEIPKDTVKRICDQLTDGGIFIKQDNCYSLSNIFCNIRGNKSDTYFNLSIKQDDKDLIKYLFKQIENIWIQAIGTKPSRVQMQKTIVEINNKLNLNLPVAWYKYGQIVPVAYDPSIDYTIDIENKQIDDGAATIRKIIEKNIVLSPKELKLRQYMDGTTKLHKLYTLKEELLKKLYDNDIKYVRNHFEEIGNYISYYEKDNSIDRFDEVIAKYNNLDEKYKKDYEIKNVIIELFNTLWNIIAIVNYKESLKDYYIKNKLDLNELEYNTLIELCTYKDAFEELWASFYDMFDFKDFYHDEFTIKLMGMVMKGN